MLVRSVVIWAAGTALAVTGSVAMFSSCGGDSGGGGGGGDAAEVTITDGAQPTTVAAGQLSVTFEAGSLETGTVVSLAAVDVPGEFSALTDVPAASRAISCTAKKDDQELAEANAPFTIVLTLNEAAALVDKNADNLCLFIKSGTTPGVWRRTALQLDEAKTKVTLKTAKFGTYMAAYCGDAALEGFEVLGGEPVASDPGTDPGEDPGAGGDAPTAFPFACYKTANKYCMYMRGTQAGGAAFADAAAHCQGENDEGLVLKQCPEEDFKVSCDGEHSKGYYYEGNENIGDDVCFPEETKSETWSAG